MKHFNGSVFLAFSFVVACTGQTLDGGSNTSGSSGDPPSGSVPNAGTSQDGISAEPFGGTVIGRGFTPTAVELHRETKSPRYSLQIHNASEPCARSRRLGADVVIITVDGVTIEDISSPIDSGDGHFQRGFYTTAENKKPETDTATQGRVKIDSEPGAPGTTVTGGAWLKGHTSEVNGKFTAKVCEQR